MDASPIALVVCQPPYRQRSARAQLDVALAAAALELPLEIFFLGNSLWQLAAQRDSAPARLPRGLKGWAALEQMTRVRFFAEPEALGGILDAGAGLLVNPVALGPGDMARRWRRCLRVMTL